MANIYNMADTWNDVATTFTAIKMDVTDTASASGSLLMDLQVGGSSVFQVGKGASLYLRDVSISSGGQIIDMGSNSCPAFQRNGSTVFWLGDGALRLASSATFGFGGTDASANDTILSRKGAANLRFGAADAAAPVAQTLSVQSATGVADTAGADFTIEGSQGTGTGAGGSILFKVAPAGSAGSGQNGLATAVTIDSTKTATFTGSVAVTDGSYGGSLGVPSAFPGFSHSSGVRVWETNTGGDFYLPQGNLNIGGAGATSNNGAILVRDGAANTLALRNGGTDLVPVPQTFNIYNYWASASDYERGFMKWNSNVLEIGTEAAGSGTTRNISVQAHGNEKFSVRSTDVLFRVNILMNDGDHIQFGSSTGSFIGVTASDKFGFWGTTPIVQPTTGVTAATFVANTSGISDDTATFDGYTIGQVVAALRSAGLLA